MEDFEEDEELIQLAIRQSVQDLNKLPCSIPTKRKEPNSEAFMEIMTALYLGDFYTLQRLSRCIPAFKERDNRGWLALHEASAQPHSEGLYLVLQAVLKFTPVSLETLTDDGDTCLTLAAEAGRVENVRMLLQHGASPYNTNGRNESPLLIAVRQKSYEMVSSLVISGAYVEQVCLSNWTATHEAAKAGCPAIVNLLLRHGAKIRVQDGNGVTPLGIAAGFGNAEALDIFIQQGGDVCAKANNGDTALYDAAGSGNLECVKMLLQYGANPNVASYANQLPIHRAAYQGHIEVLNTLIPITAKPVIRFTGTNPIHSATDGGQVECLKLLIKRGHDVNALLDTNISETYGDLRRSPLYFAVSNGDRTCAEILLAAGARTDLDPLKCILVAVRAERYDLVQLLISYGADVNCYFSVVSDTRFPTALQYSLRDLNMLRLLLNSGYHAYRCFQCCHGKDELNGDDLDSTWTDLYNEAYQICSEPEDLTISFCEFVSVRWLAHLVGSVVRMLMDYVSHVSICPNLKRILEKRPEWEEISDILRNPRSLQHLCRLVIRGRMNLRKLHFPKASAVFPFAPGLKNYLTHREYDRNKDFFRM